MDVDFLLKQGFKKTPTKEWESLCEEKRAQGMDQGGPYKMDYVLKKDDLVVTVEQNTSTIEQDGMKTQTEHPEVVKVEGPKGAVTVSAQDPELVLRLVQELS